ncbi:YigZ family protein [Defluviimonas sp. WL0050]|uniref:YigZ family protein n=1 Tax=Albidovulum litorale TaxID=2984134 RepID=A0ABT2ZKM8_9RHOB|nr:YigZ family protein [Defluviimonas sp. WL0050]MCV2871686.1 YigZ family protein [Defluviimonas sp. WL0050]
MRIIENVISDRGSRYAVSGGLVADRAAADAFIRDLTTIKKFAKATHNSWAVLLETDGQPEPLKNDDGESGAGAVILRMLEREGLTNHIVVVTRWYGGVKLGGDRFRHVTAAVRTYLAERG